MFMLGLGLDSLHTPFDHFFDHCRIRNTVANLYMGADYPRNCHEVHIVR